MPAASVLCCRLPCLLCVPRYNRVSLDCWALGHVRVWSWALHAQFAVLIVQASSKYPSIALMAGASARLIIILISAMLLLLVSNMRLLLASECFQHPIRQQPIQ